MTNAEESITLDRVEGGLITKGLNKREYFAAMAMQGITASNVHYGHFERMANDSVDIADALINALNKKP